MNFTEQCKTTAIIALPMSIFYPPPTLTIMKEGITMLCTDHGVMAKHVARPIPKHSTYKTHNQPGDPNMQNNPCETAMPKKLRSTSAATKSKARKNISVKILLLCCILTGAASTTDGAERPALWDDSYRLGGSAELPLIAGIKFHVIKKWDRPGDGYLFLHGVGLTWHKNKLYASFAHNKNHENSVSEEAHYRVSDDGGRTWGPLSVIDAGDEPNLAISHGVFLSHGGKLWAFQGAYYNHMERIHTRAYSLNEATGEWAKHGVVISNGFWPMNEPQRLANGNWIIAGFSGGKWSPSAFQPPAVAISKDDDFTTWDYVEIPVEIGERGSIWGESAVFSDGKKVFNIARRHGTASLAISEDYGRTWSPSRESNLRMISSKPAAGVLSTGQRYLINTIAAGGFRRRNLLTIAVSKPGKNVFSKVFVIRHGLSPDLPGESHEDAQLAYPCATEHEGKLYVGYSNNGGRRGNYNSAELAIIPVAALWIDGN